jgi:hypothetical protein
LYGTFTRGIPTSPCPTHFSVLFCSAVNERAKLLRIYGPELFQEEATAVEGMFRMLNYQAGIDTSQLCSEHGVSEGKDTGEDDDMGHSNGGGSEFDSVVRKLAAENRERGVQDGADIYLPPFVRKALEEMLRAQDKESKLHTWFRFLQLADERHI